MKAVLSRGSCGKWRSPNAFIPSLKDSSAPAESKITRTPAGGSSRKRWARASSETTAVPLSLAPGTTSRTPMSVIAATEPIPRNRPSLVSSRLPLRAPSAARSGPPSTGAIIIGLVSVFSIRPRRSAISGSLGWKTRPEWAESWWAMTTTVRSASRSPSSQTTL